MSGKASATRGVWVIVALMIALTAGGIFLALLTGRNWFLGLALIPAIVTVALLVGSYVSTIAGWRVVATSAAAGVIVASIDAVNTGRFWYLIVALGCLAIASVTCVTKVRRNSRRRQV